MKDLMVTLIPYVLVSMVVTGFGATVLLCFMVAYRAPSDGETK